MADSSFMQGDHDDSKAVPFTDDEADEPELAPNAPPELQLTRLQKKTERLTRKFQESGKKLERLAELEERDQKRERELAELRGQVAANNNALYARQANDNGKDPYEQRLDAAYARQNELFNNAQAEVKAGTFSAERQAYYDREARAVEQEKMRIHTERAVASSSNERRAEQAQAVWVQKYPEVYQNPRAYQFAQASFQRRLALGEQQTNALVDEVMSEAIATFKLGAKPPPTASEKSRFSGVPSSGNGGGGKGGADITMTPELKRMARAAYPDLSDDEAEKRWKAKTGRKLRERKVI